MLECKWFVMFTQCHLQYTFNNVLVLLVFFVFIDSCLFLSDDEEDLGLDSLLTHLEGELDNLTSKGKSNPFDLISPKYVNLFLTKARFKLDTVVKLVQYSFAIAKIIVDGFKNPFSLNTF